MVINMKIEIVQHQYNTRRVAIAGSPQQARIHDFAKGVPSKQEGRNFFWLILMTTNYGLLSF